MSTAEAHAPHDLDSPASDMSQCRSRLLEAIHSGQHLLPAQGPITVFVHHNTLHAFEHLSFDEAVQEGGRTFGCNAYLPKERYRAALAQGRILPADLDAELRADLGVRADERISGLCTRLELRLSMLQHPVWNRPTNELRWFVAETDALRRVRPDLAPGIRDRLIADTRRWIMSEVGGGSGASPPDGLRAKFAKLFSHFGDPSRENWNERTWEQFTLRALWRVCRDGVQGLKPIFEAPSSGFRHRDALLAATGVDTDVMVNEVMIRLCAAFLDQGFASWMLPRRELGFYQAFILLYQGAAGPPDAWLRNLRPELNRLQQAGIGPLDSIAESLAILGVTEAEWEPFISKTLLALRGWGGMIAQIEARGDRVVRPVPQGSLVEFLAVKLLLERLALLQVARTELGFSGRPEDLGVDLESRFSPDRSQGVEQQAFEMFQVAQIRGWGPRELDALDRSAWAELVEEIGTFSDMERRRIFHAAYERRYLHQTLDAVAIRTRRGLQQIDSPRFQAVFCIDDREESFRRHLEEIAPDVETLAIAGFFNVPIYFKGAAEAHYTALCPITIVPNHWVTEEVALPLADEHRRRRSTRRAVGHVSHRVHIGSRTLAAGTLLSAGLGVLASVPLVGRILFPRFAARLRRRLRTLIDPPPMTQLRLERRDAVPGPEDGHVGFSVDEMASAAEQLLRHLGLTKNFARLVIIFGHGSTSLNNPHSAAYGCGACSGAAGGPNARAVSQMLNDPRVRAILAERGLRLPETTRFIGGFHNTCDDSVDYFDLDRLPASHHVEFEEARAILQQTCERNAHERCRRFMSAPLSLSFAGALRHVEERSEDLAQPRPELGHATNAVTYVGRRSRTRGLFLDRRWFLTSYDPTQDDDESTILLRLLQAAVPVCAGIGLEYYFSHVDSPGYGCSTKLPHNVSALLGVMDGAASDLRTGLPWQMVEIHEPLRPIFIIETTPEAMHSIMDRDAAVGRLCRNGWISLALLDPDSSELKIFRNGVFRPYQPETEELPIARSSVDWYRGWRDNLEYAEIQS